jgi:hypothetical protein
MRRIKLSLLKRKCASAIVLGGCMILTSCGAPPPAMPEVSYGSLRILAMDTASIKSINFDLDDVKYGKHSNPYVLEQVVAGTHKLFVYDETLAGTVSTVEVFPARRSEATLLLHGDGPYVGNKAPSFAVTAVDGRTLDLQQLKGTIVLLAFFEHT